MLLLLRLLSFIRLILLCCCVLIVVAVTAQTQDNNNNNNNNASNGDSIFIYFEGTVIDDLGQPLVGALVQFWHTDINGNYNHPNFVLSQPFVLLDDFQYFGTSTTNINGTFNFITIRPGIYSQRPITHIHYKVWYNSQDILTSQFYFRDEGYTQYDELLQLDLIPYNDNNNNNYTNTNTNGTTTTDTTEIIMTTNKTIYVNLGLGGKGPFTPFQTSGPFYPVVDFFDYDNDLTKVKTEEEEEEEEEEGTETPSANSPDDVAPPPPTTATTIQPSSFPTPLPTTVSTESKNPTTTLPPTISTNMSLSSSEINNDGASSSYKTNVSSTSFINAIIIIGWMFVYTFGF